MAVPTAVVTVYCLTDRHLMCSKPTDNFVVKTLIMLLSLLIQSSCSYVDWYNVSKLNTLSTLSPILGKSSPHCQRSCDLVNDLSPSGRLLFCSVVQNCHSDICQTVRRISCQRHHISSSQRSAYSATLYDLT